ncbi:citrate synthase-like protein [Suillus subluteus]|nr:citrate synthase-like protein [Suillus subluteus]
MGKQFPASELKRDEFLKIVDNRTGKEYTVPITHNLIPANFFKGIRAAAGPNDRPEDETERGLRVADRGFLNTAVIESHITLTVTMGHCSTGYPIERLAERSSFLEVSYLLIYGALPSASQLSHFTSKVLLHGSIHFGAEGFFCAFRYDAHPMSMLTSAFAYLGSYYGEANLSLEGDPAALKATTLAAMAYRICQGRDFVVPPTGMSYTELSPTSFTQTSHTLLLQMHLTSFLSSMPTTKCSTTVLQTGSSLPDPFSAIAAGCASLYGPLHGGANEVVIRMLVSIGSPKNVPTLLEAVKKRQKVLSGFGHRVYKTSDPRSFIIRKVADEVFAVGLIYCAMESWAGLHIGDRCSASTIFVTVNANYFFFGSDTRKQIALPGPTLLSSLQPSQCYYNYTRYL